MSATADLDLEFAISALEAQWRADGIIMNASTFLAAAISSIDPTSVST